jgi:hypothetical protein
MNSRTQGDMGLHRRLAGPTSVVHVFRTGRSCRCPPRPARKFPKRDPRLIQNEQNLILEWACEYCL